MLCFSFSLKHGVKSDMLVCLSELQPSSQMSLNLHGVLNFKMWSMSEVYLLSDPAES